MKKPSYNLVFSGSGDKFGVQIGAWLALSEKIEAKKVVGTSGGSIIASMVALDFSIVEILRILRNLDINKFLDYYWNFPFSVLSEEKLGFIRGEKLYQKLKEFFPYQFKDLKKGLAVTTTNIDKNRLEIWGTKETPNAYLYDAIRASISLPVIFTPHEINGQRYVDGGLSENFFLKYFKTDNDPLLGIRCIDDPESFRVNSIKNLIVATIFLPIIKNEEKNIEDCPNAKILELMTTMDNYDFAKLDYQALLTQIEQGKNYVNDFLKKVSL